MVAVPYLFAGSAGTGAALAAVLRTILVSCDFKIMIVIRKLMTTKRHSCQSSLKVELPKTAREARARELRQHAL